MTSAESFVKYFNKTYIKIPANKLKPPEKNENEFLNEFVAYIPEIVYELEDHIKNREINRFYIKLKNIKFLVEYSDELNKNWYLIRAYSGGLKRLMEKPDTHHAMQVYLYYFQKYGDRRLLKDENWFEEKRWQFLDELLDVENDKMLRTFIKAKTHLLNEYFQIYKTELLKFRSEVMKLM